jgi:L-rhamnose mutarotase
MRRYGQVIGIKPERFAEYVAVHSAVWPGVLARIHASNIRNFSIFAFGDQLFGYFEYTGDDYAADMARIAADPETQRWWAVTDPMQQPVDGRAPGEWWANMTEVFHTD